MTVNLYYITTSGDGKGLRNKPTSGSDISVTTFDHQFHEFDLINIKLGNGLW
jgi:hypothetical protein